MKRIILLLLVLFATRVSAQTWNTGEFQRMGEKTILKMRSIFNIPKRVKLYATAYIYVCDLTTKKKSVPTDSIASLTVSDWLRKVYDCRHKVYVYDDQLQYFLVDNLANRDEEGCKNESYLGTKDDHAIAEMLQANRFDCVVEAGKRQDKDAKQLVLICVKRDGMYRAVVKGEKTTLKLVTKDDLLIEP